RGRVRDPFLRRATSGSDRAAVSGRATGTSSAAVTPSNRRRGLAAPRSGASRRADGRVPGRARVDEWSILESSSVPPEGGRGIRVRRAPPRREVVTVLFDPTFGRRHRPRNESAGSCVEDDAARPAGRSGRPPPPLAPTAPNGRHVERGSVEDLSISRCETPAERAGFVLIPNRA